MAQQLALKRAPAETILEITPTGSSSSLGGVERWNGTLVGLVRTLIADVESRWGITINGKSNVLPWAIRHAAWLHNRFQPHRRTGTTAFEQQQGHQYRGAMFGFSEVVMVLHEYHADRAKLDQRWSKGVWLGKQTASDSHIVGTQKGIVVGRSCKPLSTTLEPNDWELVRDLQSTPWQITPDEAAKMKSTRFEPEIRQQVRPSLKRSLKEFLPPEEPEKKKGKASTTTPAVPPQAKTTPVLESRKWRAVQRSVGTPENYQIRTEKGQAPETLSGRSRTNREGR